MIKALIVDDEPSACNFLCEALSEMGYRSVASMSEEEAITHLKVQPFDVVFIDIRLPGAKSGIDLLRKIKTLYPSITAIMATAVDDIDTAAETIELGAAAYLVKPFVIDELHSTLRRAMKGKISFHNILLSKDAQGNW